MQVRAESQEARTCLKQSEEGYDENVKQLAMYKAEVAHVSITYNFCSCNAGLNRVHYAYTVSY
jgi:hypothetical protein